MAILKGLGMALIALAGMAALAGIPVISALAICTSKGVHLSTFWTITIATVVGVVSLTVIYALMWAHENMM